METNRPIRTLAVDDEPLALRQLVAYIGRVPFLQLVGQCQSAIEASHVLEREDVDVLFCDINMPDLSGMDFVRSLTHPPIIVFTTAYSEYAVEGFKVEATDYLLKPFSFEEFSQTAQRVRQRHEMLQKVAATAPTGAGETIFVRADRSSVAVALSSIRYIQGMGEYLRIFTTGRQKPIITLLTMKAMEERLPAERFLRVHRSYIVALDEIRKVARSRVELADGSEIPVGDMARAALDAWLRSKK